MVIGKAQELTKFPLLSLKKKIYIEINDEIKNHAKERLKTLGRIIIKKRKREKGETILILFCMNSKNVQSLFSDRFM